MDTVHLLIYETCILYNYMTGLTAFITQQLLYALQNLQSALSRAVLYIARPSVRLSPFVRPSLTRVDRGSIKNGWCRLCNFHRTVNPYLQFLRLKFHSEIPADSLSGDVKQGWGWKRAIIYSCMRRYLEKGTILR